MAHPLLLVADNNEDDRFFLRRAMTRLALLNPFEEVHTGEEVQDYFKRKGRFANRIGYLQAVILLLDVHLPAMSGVDVLRWIRRDHPSELIGVLLWTASSSPEEKLAIREEGFPCVDKPSNLLGYEQLFHRFPGLKLECSEAGKVLKEAPVARAAEIVLRA